MATAARYWRVYFRSNDATGSSAYSYGFNHMRWFNSSGTELSASLLAAAITTSAPSYNTSTYPLIALTDSNVATSYWVYYTGSPTNQGYTWYYIQFDFGSAVLPEYILINMGATAVAGTLLNCANMDFAIDSSTDNVTYTRQAMLFRPIQATATDTRIPAVITSTLYPLPDRTMYGGSGGIYGIVSEDGVALPNRPVYLFERDTFFKVGYTTTDENGGYAFNSLNENREYTVMSVDPSGPPYKNALVWDWITPINTKSNIAPLSAFWAKRGREVSLGGLVAVKEYIDGPTYNYLGNNTLGQSENRWGLPDDYNFETTLQLNESVGGALKFLKSSRTPTYTGEGIQFYTGMGCFTGVNAGGIAANFSALTFEYIFKAPSNSESALIFVWAGTRDSDDGKMYETDAGYTNQTVWGSGPTLEVTPAGVINVRISLGGRNRTTVRATTSITPGTVHHVMVTFLQDTEIKLYLDGSLVQTTAISATGRLWGTVVGTGNTITVSFENWDYYMHANQYSAAIRRINVLIVAGYGNTINNSTSNKPGGPGFGGSFGMAAMYNRVFSASDVAAFYDSWRNWDTHTLIPSQSGYLGEIEADLPVMHLRLNDATAPTRISSLFGPRDYLATYEGTPLFNQTGFINGTTSVNVSTGGVLVTRIDVGLVFTAEFWCRPTSVAGTQRLFVSRVYNSSAPVYLSIVSGVLRLTVIDVSGTTTDFVTTVTLAINTTYHIAVSYDPVNTKLFNVYINGSPVYSTAASVLPTNNPTWLGIGVNPSGTAPSYSERFQGTMADFTLYNYVVPAARILAHYNARNS